MGRCEACSSKIPITTDYLHVIRPCATRLKSAMSFQIYSHPRESSAFISILQLKQLGSRGQGHTAGDVSTRHEAPLTTVLLHLAFLEPEWQPLLWLSSLLPKLSLLPGAGLGCLVQVSLAPSSAPDTISLPIPHAPNLPWVLSGSCSLSEQKAASAEEGQSRRGPGSGLS